ncbi:hypothetical protein AXG93_2912s1120 [Marchantia polymorpha subsp. ruderalis]|uniref:Uncharacterized protein n=1 Tax=Marchantia polymorpha subsp. ruderalis TaxID=1480154 RepID=A0A176WHN6_MARPO|nr:hypothetical protein AXG93_2912s1120 [Marchantia polymorpha subsp. ruderalis]
MRLLMLCAIGTLGDLDFPRETVIRSFESKWIRAQGKKGILMASADKKARRLHEEQVSMDEKLKQLDQKA